MRGLACPAANTAKMTSFGLPSMASRLTSMVCSLGKHSSIVSLACFSKDLRGLPDAIATAYEVMIDPKGFKGIKLASVHARVVQWSPLHSHSIALFPLRDALTFSAHFFKSCR